MGTFKLVHITRIFNLIEEEFLNRGLLIDDYHQVYGCKSYTEIWEKIHALLQKEKVIIDKEIT